jgi:hypothetical protein
VADLVSVIRRLNPNVPAGLLDDALPRIDRPSNAMRQIRTQVSADPLAKVLLAGHIGVGKSTELLELGRQMEQDRLVIRFSVAEYLGVHNVNTFALLLALLEVVVRHPWAQMTRRIPPEIVEQLKVHWNQLSRRLVQSGTRDRGLAGRLMPSAVLFRVGALVRRDEKGSRVIHSAEDVVRVYAETLQQIALRAVKFEEVIALDPSPFVASCELVLKELEGAAGKPVLVIIDDLDKVRNDEARDDVFLTRAMAWQQLPCGIVATVPLDAVFSDIGPELDQVWLDVQVLEPLPVRRAGLLPSREPTLQPYLQILRSVGAEEVFSGMQCQRLAYASGGLPRVFVSMCAACARYALDSGEDHVCDYHVDLVFRDIADKWRGRLNDSDYEALAAVLDSGGSNVPAAIPLLRDGILIRDGAAAPDRQFRLAPWAEPLVEAYRERTSRVRPAAP